MTLEERTRPYLIMAHFGGLVTVSMCLIFGFDLPVFVKGLSIGVMIAPLAVMLICRFRDEYSETLWQAGRISPPKSPGSPRLRPSASASTFAG